MYFNHEQPIYVKVGSPIFTIYYKGKNEKELHAIGKVMEKESKGYAVNEVFTESTAYDQEHTHVRLDGNFWIVANENISLREEEEEKTDEV
jgi:hypothetical protein